MNSIQYIEHYMASMKDVTTEFDMSCDFNNGFKYWARFSQAEEESERYTHFVQANGSSFEEVATKIVEYLKSGERYNDGRLF